MARSKKKKKEEEGEVPIIHGWQRMPIRALIQDDELMTAAASRVNLKKDLYGDDLPESKGVHFDDASNTLFIYYQTEPQGMVQPTDGTLLTQAVESQDNLGVLYHFDRALAVIEIKNFKIVYEEDDAAKLIIERTGEEEADVLEFLEAKRDYERPRSHSFKDDGCFIEAHIDDPDDVLQFIQSVTSLSVPSIVKMMVEEVAYMEQLGGVPPGSYENAQAWKKEKLGDGDDAPLLG